MTHVATLLALLLQSPAGGIEWSKTLEDAKKASVGKKPIVVLLTQKGCALSGELFKSLSRDDRVSEVSKDLVWIAVVVGTDEYKKWFAKQCGASVEGTPSILFLNPKGENADPAYAGLPTVSSADPDDLFPVLREVMQRAKRELPEAQKAKIEAAEGKARAATVPAESLAAWRQVVRLADGWRTEAKRVEEARAAIEKALQEGCAEMLRIQSSERDPQAAKKAYETVRTQYAGTFLADWALEELKRLK